MLYLIFAVGFGLAYAFGYRAGWNSLMRSIAWQIGKQGVDAWTNSLKAAIAARKVGNK